MRGTCKQCPTHKRKKGSRQGKGNASINTIQDRRWVYLKLLYLDPQGVKRAFPVNFPVVVRYGADRDAVDGVNTVEHREVTTLGGALTFPARLKLGNPWRNLTLRFGADHPAAVTPPVSSGRYIWVEEPGQAQLPGFTSADAALQGMQATTKSRFFLVPHRWSLRTADWSLNKPIAGNGRFDAASAQLSHTVKKVADIGTRAAPVELLLDPHWHFLRFEYFDRYMDRYPEALRGQGTGGVIHPASHRGGLSLRSQRGPSPGDPEQLDRRRSVCRGRHPAVRAVYPSQRA